MYKTLGFAVLTAAFFLTTPATANVHMLQPNMTVEYEFEANKKEEFTNIFYWTIEAVCEVATEDEYNDMFAEILNKKGKINGITLSQGQTLLLTVKHGDRFKISADSGAKVALTNLGLHTLKATCTA